MRKLICFTLAEKLRQPVREVMSWPIEEIRDWCAYYEFRDRQEKNAKRR